MMELEAEPGIASELFGERIELARAYTHDLAQRGEELGLIGPLELPRLWTRHIINCVLPAPLLQGSVADVGSGAGLPGLVMAIARPDVQFALIEPMERRVDWLTQQVEALRLSNVRVIRARSEEVGEEFDQVTARAVSALSKLIPATAHLTRTGGQLLFLKGSRVHDEVTAAAKAIRKHKVRDIEILTLGLGIVADPTTVFRATVD